MANSLTKSIWSWQLEMFVERIRMSSACEKAPRLRPQTLRPHDLLLSSRSRGSTMSRKRMGDGIEP